MALPVPAPRPVRLSYENVARILYGRLDEGFTGIQRRFLRDLFQLQDEQAGRAALSRLLGAAGGGQTIPAVGSAAWNALTDELRTIAAEHQLLFNEQAQAVIRSAAQAAGQAVPEVAGLAAGNRSALRSAWNQVDPLAVEAAMTTMHRPAFEQAVRNYGDQYVKAAQSILITGLASGQNPRTTARLLRQMMTTMPAQSATTMARTLQMNAYRSATSMHQRANSRVLAKQVRVAALDARCCAACLALHGKEYPVGEEIVDHAQGRCIGIGIPRGSEVTVESGPEWLDRQPESVQQQILGRAGWNAWRAGAVRLDQFVGYRTDPIWGRQTVQRSLRGILGQDTAARYYVRNQGRGGSAPARASGGRTAPVSAALDVSGLPDYRDARGRVAGALAAIDRVHTDGQLPRIAVRATSGESEYLAPWRLKPGQTEGVLLNVRRDTLELDAAHEAAHVLDIRALGGNPLVKDQDGSVLASVAAAEGRAHPMRGWWEAVQGTPEYLALSERRALAVANEASAGFSAEILGYALRPPELWARSYTQYIAQRSGNAELQSSIAVVRAETNVYRLFQWDADSFEPIARAMDDLFSRMGWR